MTPDDELRRLRPDAPYLYVERAAICEHDGKLPRERAEALALAEVRRRYATPCRAR